MQTAEELMPPATRTFGEGDSQYTEVKHLFASIPEDLIRQVGEIVDTRKQTRQGATRRELYTEAVEDLLSDLRRGDKITIESTAKAGKSVQLWLRDDLAEEFEQVCLKLNRRKNVVFNTALVRWLERWNAERR